MTFPTETEINQQVRAFLKEDIGSGDLTAAIIPEATIATAEVISRENMILCGRLWFDSVFRQLDSDIEIDWLADEGAIIKPGQMFCRLSGKARGLLTGERTALNLLQMLSGIATESGKYAAAAAGTGCRILDTRKTIPGLRKAQKYAVKCGGCSNHRFGLYDAILIKENHIISAGSIAAAVQKARKIASVSVEVEVENLDELNQALSAGADRIMLDNFSVEELRKAVEINAGRAELEASGNVELAKIRVIAETGVNFISVGALTKNIKAIDLSMRIILSS